MEAYKLAKAAWEAGQRHQTSEAVVTLNNLLNAITEDIKGMIKDRREAHDKMDWPHKFLVAHEGIGLMKAIELIEARRKDTGI